MVIRRDIRKMFIQNLFLVLIFCVEVVSPTSITPPGMQRKKIGESCTLQWTIQGSFANYTVFKKSTGTLSASATHSEDRARGIITLIIRSVQLEDAGHYSLSVTAGTSSTTDNGALLFVYGNFGSTLTQTNGSNPAIEGSSVELTCGGTSASQPAEYKPKPIYFWSLGDLPHLQNFSNGSAALPGRELPTGYSFKNDGRSLVIDSVQYRDRQIKCRGREEGSSIVCCEVSHNIVIHYRPQVVSRSPANGRFHADVNIQIELRLSVNAMPVITIGNWVWSFVSTAGVTTTLPPAITQDHQSYVFQLTSQTFYGNYTITLYNTIGSTKETFQVLPPVPPDTPSHLKVVYAVHRRIQVQWNCMASNGRQQTIFVRLNKTASNAEIEIRNTTVPNACYNSSQTTLFQRNIRPETSYEVSVWSSNALGSSDVVKLVVETPKKFKLIVSSKTIVVTGTRATINFSTQNGNMTYLTVSCCAESTGNCRSKHYEETDPAYPVLFNDLSDDENVYIFDFTAYGGPSNNRYYLTMVKGIRISETADDDDGTTTPLLIATAVLAVLLLIALLALVLLLVLMKRKKHRQNPPNLPIIEEKAPQDLSKKNANPRLPKRPLPVRKPTPSVAQKPPPEDDPEEETYELADAPKSTDDDFYMPLNEKPTRAMRNQYS